MTDSPAVKSDDQAMNAVFRTWDSHIAADIAAFGVGFEETLRGGVAAPVSGMKAKTPRRPQWVLIQVDELGVHLFESDRAEGRGRLIMEAAPATFRASLHRYVGEIWADPLYPW